MAKPFKVITVTDPANLPTDGSVLMGFVEQQVVDGVIGQPPNLIIADRVLVSFVGVTTSQQLIMDIGGITTQVPLPSGWFPVTPSGALSAP